tara:strand:- start:3110 stop:3382 length:273 start_codon:yes stop_codon:yes gene_type:complete
MNEKPLIERLSDIYDEQRFSWFVIDGQGNTMAEGLDELSAREYSMKDSNYSIGWKAEDTEEPYRGSTRYNVNGDAITYANKDILNEEDFL